MSNCNSKLLCFSANKCLCNYNNKMLMKVLNGQCGKLALLVGVPASVVMAYMPEGHVSPYRN